MNNEKYEIVKFVDDEFELDVNVSPNENTVWLSRQEISLLFVRDRTVISRHIKNIFTEELDKKSNVHFLHIPNSDKPIEIYSLDVVISVGYRVKSIRGVLFRKWANSILKQYLLNGYSFNEKRCLSCQDNLLDLKERVSHIENKMNNEDEIYKEKLFYENQIFDGYSFIKQLMLTAKSEIIIIDGYIDLSVLDMLNDVTVPITIYTLPSAYLTNQDIAKFQINHILNVIKDTKYHDRFLIIDDDVYSLGSSIKDIGKKISVMTKLTSITKEMIIK